MQRLGGARPGAVNGEMRVVGVIGHAVAADPPGGDHLYYIRQTPHVGQAKKQLQGIGEVTRRLGPGALGDRIAHRGDRTIGDGGDAGSVEQ